jgi:hypothetical protein
VHEVVLMVDVHQGLVVELHRVVPENPLQ